MVEQLGSGMSRSKIKLTQDVKYIRRLLMVRKICGVSKVWMTILEWVESMGVASGRGW